ncbi:MAG: AAA family ATPase [Betaproteobacteria bacterium]|nr:MAG: AAA family ATPase [Betaproteobacteria bacterium]
MNQMSTDREFDAGVTIPGPQSAHSTPIDRLSTLFALRLVLTLGPKFNLRRDINDVMTLSARHLIWPVSIAQKVQKFLAGRCVDMPAWAGVAKLSPEEFIARHGVWNGTYDDTTLFYYLDEFCKQNAKDLLALFQTTVDALEKATRDTPVRIQQNIDMLAKVLTLNPSERALILCASLAKVSRDLRPILVDCKAASAAEAHAMLGDVMKVSPNDVGVAMKPGGRLESLALIDAPIAEHNITDLGDLMRLSDRLLPILQENYADEGEMMAAFTKPARASELTLADYPHVEDDARYLAAMLKAATARGEKGVNVLIYGAPGTGKTEFAKVVSALSGAELYEVECFDREGQSLSGKERYRSLQVSQSFLKGRTNTVLLFDEVEDVFPTNPSEALNMFLSDERHRGSVNGKAWVNQTLESNPVPTIWISNSINQIDPAYRRRFQFHLELKNPPQNVRANITRKHLSGLDVTDEFVEKLAARRTLTPAQIHAAARFAQLAKGEVADSVEELVLKQLDRSDAALGFKEEDRESKFRPLVTTYDLSLLNIESRHPVDKMIEAIAKKGKASLCFYGMPGTGKTALGEHIAKSIERPLIIKKASDLVSKYVGETEQNMAAMFKEATTEKAVLLLDEADSFLRARSMAQRSYEVTEVNEMLQQMERFDGVFICTTNLIDQVDEAALRRFTFKIQFKPLTREQRERMFATEALDGDASKFTEKIRNGLHKMEMLTPGDFAAVKRQIVLFDETLPPDEFLAQLEQEHRVKPDIKWSRSIGF